MEARLSITGSAHSSNRTNRDNCVGLVFDRTQTYIRPTASRRSPHGWKTNSRQPAYSTLEGRTTSPGRSTLLRLLGVPAPSPAHLRRESRALQTTRAAPKPEQLWLVLTIKLLVLSEMALAHRSHLSVVLLRPVPQNKARGAPDEASHVHTHTNPVSRKQTPNYGERGEGRGWVTGYG